MLKLFKVIAIAFLNFSCVTAQIKEVETKVGNFENSWALIIGIDNYKNSDIPNLRYAVKDGKGISDLLIHNQYFSEDRVLTLYNKDAYKENILKTFENK